MVIAFIAAAAVNSGVDGESATVKNPGQDGEGFFKVICFGAEKRGQVGCYENLVFDPWQHVDLFQFRL